MCFTLTAGLTACSGTDNDGNSSGNQMSDGAASNEEVTLRYAIWGATQQDVSQELADAFHEKYPNITVEVEYTPQNTGEYWTKLESSCTGGSAPDVFWMNGVHADEYIEGGMVMDLTSVVTESEWINWAEDFPETLKSTYIREDKVYGIPKDFDTIAVWYNKMIFDAADVAYPTDDWTWDEMVEIARKLTDVESGTYGITAEMNGQQYYYPTISANGGYILSDDMTSCGYADENTIKGFSCWLDLIEEGLSPSLQQLTDTASTTLFESNHLAMLWAGSWNTASYMSNEALCDNVGIVELPSVNGQKGNCINGLGFMVYSRTQHPQEAKLFAEWLGSEEAQQIQGKSGTVISARKDCQSLFMEVYPELNLQAYLNQVDCAMSYPCSKVTNQMLTAEYNYLPKAWSGEMSIEDACKAIAEEVNPLLEEAYK